MEREDVEGAFEEWTTFVAATFRAGLGLFPLLFSLNTVFLTPARPAWLVALVTLAVAIPVGAEITFSERNVEALEQYVVGVILLWLVATGLGLLAGALGSPPGDVEAIRIFFVIEGYVLSYLMVYRGWGIRLQAALGG